MAKHDKLINFSFDYPPNDGGIARLNEAIVRGLAQRGLPIEVLTQQRPSRHIPEVDSLVPTKRVTARRPLRELAALRAVFKHRGTVCISGIWYPEGVIVRYSRGRNHVVLAYGAELFSHPNPWIRPILNLLKRQVFETATVVIADSQYAVELVKRSAPRSNSVSVPLAVDHRHFQQRNRAEARVRWGIPNDIHVISSVSRVHRFKGHETVLNALAKLTVEVRRSFIYLVAGTGPDIFYFQQCAEELGVADQVRWLGFVSDDDLPSLYSASDLFVLMTREIPEERSVEGFGLVFLEAQACGTPVVGTRTGGIPDAISHGDGGWLVDQDDSSELAGILLNLQRDPHSFHEMGLKARQRIEREFTWDHYLERFIVALESAGITLDGS